MYFPGDPLFPLDPIYNTIRSQADRERLISTYDHDLTIPEFSMGYRLDIVVDGPDATWFEPEGEHDMTATSPTEAAEPRTHEATAGQTIGPFFAFGLSYPKMHEVVFPHSPGRDRARGDRVRRGGRSDPRRAASRSGAPTRTARSRGGAARPAR